jgi:hypothetical protein
VGNPRPSFPVAEWFLRPALHVPFLDNPDLQACTPSPRASPSVVPPISLRRPSVLPSSKDGGIMEGGRRDNGGTTEGPARGDRGGGWPLPGKWQGRSGRARVRPPSGTSGRRAPGRPSANPLTQVGWVATRLGLGRSLTAFGPAEPSESGRGQPQSKTYEKPYREGERPREPNFHRFMQIAWAREDAQPPGQPPALSTCGRVQKKIPIRIAEFSCDSPGLFANLQVSWV